LAHRRALNEIISPPASLQGEFLHTQNYSLTSAIGPKRPFGDGCLESAFGGKADIEI
jgi:hypothetical protein